MLILSPVLILLFTAILLSLLGWLRPKTPYLWLLAAGGSFISWVMTWYLRSQIEHTFTLLDWGRTGVLDFSPALRLDGISWTFAMALSTLVLAVILTDVSRAGEANWSHWAGSLAISALGILAVMAGNIETILIIWVVIDILDLITLLLRVRGSEKQQGVILFFATSFFGTMLVLWAIMISYTQNVHLIFENVSPTINLFLITAVGLRLGVLPLQAPFMHDLSQQRGIGTIIKLTLPAASLLLLVRVADAGVPSALKPYLLVLAGLAALYGAIAWARSKDEIRGRRYWILSLAAFAIASAIQGKPEATLSWSLILIYSGALIFLASVHTRSRLIILLIGIFGISTFPFSASQVASNLFSAPFNLLLLIFVIAHAILLSGFLRHALRPDEKLSGVEPWVRAVYPLGLMFLLLTHWLTGTLFSIQIETIMISPMIWSGGAAVLLAAAITFIIFRKISIPIFIFSSLEIIFSLGWFYRLLGRFFNMLGSILKFFADLIEGEGGVLWAILLVTLILTIVFQLGSSAGGI